MQNLSNKLVFGLMEKDIKILVPINLFGKHWVGVAVEKISDKITITYMDSEQKEMPSLLREQLTEQISACHPECQVVVKEAELELQKYNNCGVEVIENFLLYLTGCRLAQEKAVEFHSWLLEEYLTIEQLMSPRDVGACENLEHVNLAGVDTLDLCDLYTLLQQ